MVFCVSFKRIFYNYAPPSFHVPTFCQVPPFHTCRISHFATLFNYAMHKHAIPAKDILEGILEQEFAVWNSTKKGQPIISKI